MKRSTSHNSCGKTSNGIVLSFDGSIGIGLCRRCHKPWRNILLLKNIKKMMADDSAQASLGHTRYPYTFAAIQWMIENEMAVTV